MSRRREAAHGDLDGGRPSSTADRLVNTRYSLDGVGRETKLGHLLEQRSELVSIRDHIARLADDHPSAPIPLEQIAPYVVNLTPHLSQGSATRQGTRVVAGGQKTPLPMSDFNDRKFRHPVIAHRAATMRFPRYRLRA